MMTLYVFGFDEDGMAGARTLLTALMPLSTMSAEEKVEYERNVRQLIRVGTRAEQGLEEAAKTMSQAKLREVEEEGEDESAEVNISSYPATSIARSFFFRRAEILNSGGFVQKYWSVTAARYRYVLSSHAPRLFGFYQTKPSCSENLWKL